jgi:prepilin-type N-terminal cleavage/methylation domain-containing protein
MKRKGFTLVELLVVIAIIALLMSILMPALARVRALAQRVVCGSHLSSLGKQLVIYANDQEDRYPRAGGANSQWGLTLVWDAPPAPPTGSPPVEWTAYGINSTTPGKATIGACLYYLIKYADASPKVFNCGSDIGARVFQLSDTLPNQLGTNQNLLDAWDFGPSNLDPDATKCPMAPRLYCSYAYQYPFCRLGKPGYFPINALSDSGIAIMADSSPYLALSTDASWKWFRKKGNTSYAGGTEEQDRFGNSPNHKGDGQNVLYNDGHVSWSDVAYCGFDGDNIYSMANTKGGTTTLVPSVGYIFPVSTTNGGTQRCFTPIDGFRPISKTDSLLINEGLDQGGITALGS